GSEAFNFLADGQTLTLTYTVRATDDSPSAAHDDQTVTVTITGTNDAPVITWAEYAGSITENAAQPGSSALRSINRNVAFTDVDLVNGVHSLDIVPDATTHPLGLFLGDTSFSPNDPTGNANGETRTLWFHLTNIPDSALDFLGEGESFTQTY